MFAKPAAAAIDRHKSITGGLLQEAENTMANQLKDAPTNESGHSFMNTLRLFPIFFRNKVFIFSVLGLANLCFVITVIQFWGTDYMENVLNIPAKTSSLAYMIVCLTAPTIGVIVGGIIISCLGGYESINASYMTLLGAISASLLTLPIPLSKTLYSYNGFLYGVLVFGGMIFPSILGIILNSVPIQKRAIASSITVIFCNLLGYIPAPFFYGLLNDIFKESKPNLANTICMYYSILGAVFIALSVIARKIKFSIRESGAIPKRNSIKMVNEEGNISKRLSIEHMFMDKQSNLSYAMLFHNQAGSLVDPATDIITSDTEIEENPYNNTTNVHSNHLNNNRIESIVSQVEFTDSI